MEDPALTLKALIGDSTNWDITNPRHSETTFRYGPPVNVTRRFAPKDVSIEIGKLVAPHNIMSRGHTVVREVIPVDIWVRVVPATEDGKEAAATKRQNCIDKIRAIVRANQDDPSATVKFMWIGRPDTSLDSLGVKPPYLRTIVHVLCLYHI